MATGNPESTLGETVKTPNTPSKMLQAQGYDVSPSTVSRKLKEMNYSLPSNKKSADKSNLSR